MNPNDYMYNPQENVFLAMLEENLKDYNGNEFAVVGTPLFEEDSVVGKYTVLPANSYLSIKNPGFAVGTGDFTMDTWIYNKGNYSSVSTSTRSSDLGIALWPHPYNKRTFFGSGYTGTWEKSIFMNSPLDTWSHFAVVRKNGKAYAFTNGILQGSVDLTFDFTSDTLVLNTGYSNSNSHLAASNNYKAVRFCNFARWTEDFEVPNPKELGTNKPSLVELPAGMILHFGMTQAPEGWLKCDGSEVAKADYPKLFAAIGNNFGELENKNNFKLPDLRGEFIRGWDEGRGLDNGRIFASEQEDALQDHSHYSGGVITRSIVNEMSVARVAEETRPHNVALLPCIKY